MKLRAIPASLALAALIVGSSAFAADIVITGSSGSGVTLDLLGGTPADCTGVGTGTDPAWIAASCPAMSSLTEYYKATPGTPVTEVGALAGSYATTFTSPGDWDGGTITWNGPSAINCPTCWLMVKDGNQTPGRYGYNLSTLGWDGKGTITLSAFWPANGSISHWALYGDSICTVDCGGGPPGGIPEPAPLALIGLALGAAAIARRQKKNS